MTTSLPVRLQKKSNNSNRGQILNLSPQENIPVTFSTYVKTAILTATLLSICFIRAPEALAAGGVSYWEDLQFEKEIGYPNGWFYTLEEIKHQYEIEYEEGKRLANSIVKKDGFFVASCNGDAIKIPTSFVNRTLHLIQSLLEQKLARFIFRLDAFHAHLFVPEHIFDREYSSLATREMIRLFANEDSLGLLFHTAEHLALRNPKNNGPVDPEAKSLIEKRNVIGWYDTRPLEVISLNRNPSTAERRSLTATIPPGYRGVGTITFKATKNGEFSIFQDGKEIRIDISPYECYYH